MIMTVDLKDIFSVNDDIAKSAAAYADRVLNSNERTVVLDLYNIALPVLDFIKYLVNTIENIGSTDVCSVVLKNIGVINAVSGNLMTDLSYNEYIEIEEDKHNNILTIRISPTSLCDKFKEGSFKCMAEKAISSANSGLDVCDTDIAMYYSYFALLNMLKEYLLHIKKYSVYMHNETSLMSIAKFSGIYFKKL